MDRNSMKITVFGVGGVGGAVAAMLLKQYGPERVSLVARGARRDSLLKNGLTIEGDFTGSFTVPAGRVTADPAELGVQDMVLVSVKNDVVPSVVEQIRPMVGEKTLVIPVMNGVTAATRFREGLETGIVLPSVIYIVSMSRPDFSIYQKGKFMEVRTGVQPGDEKNAPLAKEACEILGASGILWQYSDNVLSDVWQKYALNCAFNTATARWGCPIGGIKSDPEKAAEFRALAREAAAVGRAMGVDLPEDLEEDIMRRMQHTRSDSTTSLSRDFAEGKRGEMEVFSGDLCRMAERAGVDVPVCRAYYAALREIAAKF